MNNSILIYIWYHNGGQVSTFAGYDHVNKLTKTYTSYDVAKILTLARKLADQYKVDIIEEYEN